MSETAKGKPPPAIPVVAVVEEVVRGFSNESEFMHLAVELAKEALSYFALAAGTMGSKPKWTRDQAIIGGNMVRLVKLTTAFLDQICQRRLEAAMMLARLIFETCVTVRYLATNHDEATMLSYIHFSLRHERKLWDTIQKNIADRGGEIIPIETRMLRSLERSESISGIKLSEISLKNRSPWGNKNIYQRAEAVDFGEAYLALFGGLSHFIHGSWEEIFRNHLDHDADGFSPHFSWHTPRPQVVTASCVIGLVTAVDFWNFLLGESVPEEFPEAVDDLMARLSHFDDLHEQFLQRVK